MDIYRQFRKNAGSTELVLVGRIAILILVGISIVWIPVLENQSNGMWYLICYCKNPKF